MYYCLRLSGTRISWYHMEIFLLLAKHCLEIIGAYDTYETLHMILMKLYDVPSMYQNVCNTLFVNGNDSRLIVRMSMHEFYAQNANSNPAILGSPRLHLILSGKAHLR